MRLAGAVRVEAGNEWRVSEHAPAYRLPGLAFLQVSSGGGGI